MDELKEIITDETVLVERAKEVNILTENKEMRNTISELKKIIRKKGLTGLSAPAIGVNKRIFCIAFADAEIKTFINPTMSIIDPQPYVIVEECTCLPGKRFIIPRFASIAVQYETPQGQIMSKKLLGAAAFKFQHEFYHLESVLISDVGLEVDQDFFDATDEERNEVINCYLDSLDYKKQEIEKAISECPEEKELYDAIRFLNGVADGTVKVEKDEDDERSDKENTDKENS